VELVTPIGFWQRGLIVSPPRAQEDPDAENAKGT